MWKIGCSVLRGPQTLRGWTTVLQPTSMSQSTPLQRLVRSLTQLDRAISPDERWHRVRHSVACDLRPGWPLRPRSDHGRPRTGRAAATRAILLAVLSGARGANAAGTDTNVVTASADAFGIAIGVEALGVYGPAQVRGFDPITAGNARIEGMYVDVHGPTIPYGPLPARLAQDTHIRVGLAAAGFPFPSPTGIVDFSLRSPLGNAGLSSTVYIGPYGTSGFDLDAHAPLADGHCGVGGGVTRRCCRQSSGPQACPCRKPPAACPTRRLTCPPPGARGAARKLRLRMAVPRNAERSAWRCTAWNRARCASDNVRSVARSKASRSSAANRKKCMVGGTGIEPVAPSQDWSFVCRFIHGRYPWVPTQKGACAALVKCRDTSPENSILFGSNSMTGAPGERSNRLSSAHTTLGLVVNSKK